MSNKDQNVRADIGECERLRYDAMIRGDVQALDRMFAEEAVYTHSKGERDTKQSYLEKVARKHFDYLRIDRPEQEISVVGDTAIVVGRMTADVRVEDKIRRLDNRNLAVWVRCDGEWKFLAYQPTVMASSGTNYGSVHPLEIADGNSGNQP